MALGEAEREDVQDSYVAAYLSASTPVSEAAALQRLIAEVMPSVDAVVRRRIGGAGGTARNSDAEDLRQDALHAVLRMLRRLKEDPVPRPIANVRAYAAAVARSQYGMLLRRRFPQRWKLESKLTTIARAGVGFDIWEENDVPWIGRANRRTERARPDRLSRLANRPNEAVAAAIQAVEPEEMPLAEALARVLDWLGGAAPLSLLASGMAPALGCADATLESRTDAGTGAELETAAAGPDASSVISARDSLRAVWAEVIQLPLRQRMAILLNLRDRDGHGVLFLLPLSGATTFHEIASSLAMSEAELQSIWGSLPAPDNWIAQRLNVTPMEVTSLRAVGRRRLKRRFPEIFSENESA